MHSHVLIPWPFLLLYSSFVGAATKVVKSFEDILEQKIAAIAALGVSFTASAQETKSTWPYVTLHDFQQRSASTRSLSGSFFSVVLPIIMNDTRSDWEAYSVANKWWLTEGQEYQVAKGLGNKDLVIWNNTPAETNISPKIYEVDENLAPTSGLGVRKWH